MFLGKQTFSWALGTCVRTRQKFDTYFFLIFILLFLFTSLLLYIINFFFSSYCKSWSIVKWWFLILPPSLIEVCVGLWFGFHLTFLLYLRIFFCSSVYFKVYIRLHSSTSNIYFINIHKYELSTAPEICMDNVRPLGWECCVTF